MSEHSARRSHLFFALWPDDETRSAIALAARALRESTAARGRWIGAHRYHLTLAFLGAFESDDIAATIERASAAADGVDASPLDIELDVTGSFRNRSIPWWFGCATIDARVVALWTALDIALRADGFRVEGDHIAHVTVLRDADRPLLATPFATFGAHPVRWRADDFVLVESRLGADARYDIAGRWPLRG